MKESIGVKIAAGLSSAAITGAFVLVLEQGTTSLPSHWAIDVRPVEVQLVGERKGGDQCEWLSSDSKEPIARCPSIVVRAKRLQTYMPDALAKSQGRSVEAVAQLTADSHSDPKQRR